MSVVRQSMLRVDGESVLERARWVGAYRTEMVAVF